MVQVTPTSKSVPIKRRENLRDLDDTLKVYVGRPKPKKEIPTIQLRHLVGAIYPYPPGYFVVNDYWTDNAVDSIMEPTHGEIEPAVLQWLRYLERRVGISDSRSLGNKIGVPALCTVPQFSDQIPYEGDVPRSSLVSTSLEKAEYIGEQILGLPDYGASEIVIALAELVREHTGDEELGEIEKLFKGLEPKELIEISRK